jgi:hypothetical protein
MTMSATHWMPTLLFCAVFAAGTASQALAYDEDNGTQMNFENVGNVHICGNNGPMVGLDAAHNRFLCSTNVFVAAPSTWTADTSTHQTFRFNGAQVSIHTCPSDEVMMGFSLDRNVLICASAQFVGFGGGSFAPPGTAIINVDGGANETKIAELNFDEMVHGCSSNDGPPVMTGIKADDNLFVCIFFEAPLK